MTKRRRG